MKREIWKSFFKSFYRDTTHKLFIQTRPQIISFNSYPTELSRNVMTFLKQLFVIKSPRRPNTERYNYRLLFVFLLTGKEKIFHSLRKLKFYSRILQILVEQLISTNFLSNILMWGFAMSQPREAYTFFNCFDL